VNSSGPVASDTGNGIATNATTGATAINITGGSVTGGANGIDAVGTTGTIAVTLSGGADVTGTSNGIDVASAGNRTVTIGAGSVVSAGIAGINSSGAGTTTVTNAGTITGTSAALFAVGIGDGAWTVTNSTGGIINGRVDLTTNNDSITNAGVWNVSSVNNFYTGADTVTNQAGGVINVAAATSLNGLETLGNAGTINALSGVTFDATANSFSNTGILNATGIFDFGGGVDVMNNLAAGTVNTLGNTTLSNLRP
jgi:hypothetical protein